MPTLLALQILRSALARTTCQMLTLQSMVSVMPSIAVIQNATTAFGNATRVSSMFPAIRYAGLFAIDPPNDLGQGEATMFDGTGSQTSASGRWGDYSMTTIDPADNISFWHTNEYYVTTGISWSTRIGKFQFPAG